MTEPNPLLAPELARRGPADGWRTASDVLAWTVAAHRGDIPRDEMALLDLIAGTYDTAAANALTFGLTAAFLDLLARTGDIDAAQAVADSTALRAIKLGD